MNGSCVATSIGNSSRTVQWHF